MWNRYQTTSINLELIIAQESDASSSILVSLKCKAPSPAPTVGLVGTPETIVIMNHAARYAKPGDPKCNEYEQLQNVIAFNGQDSVLSNFFPCAYLLQ